jgi:hypothetical protein
MTSFEQITQTATQTQRSWTNKQIAQFHFFNPYGLMAQKRATDTLINELVDAGKAKTGAHIAYGSMNDFYWKELYKLVDKKRVNSIDLSVTLSGVRDTIKQAQNFINEINTEVAA